MSGSLNPVLPILHAIGIAGLLTLSGCGSHAAKNMPAPPKSVDSAAHAPLSADPELAAAERSAIAQLSEFSAALARAESWTQNFEIKAAVTDGPRSEPLWLIDVRSVPGGFEGSVNSRPEVVKSVQ